MEAVRWRVHSWALPRKLCSLIHILLVIHFYSGGILPSFLRLTQPSWQKELSENQSCGSFVDYSLKSSRAHTWSHKLASGALDTVNRKRPHEIKGNRVFKWAKRSRVIERQIISKAKFNRPESNGNFQVSNKWAFRSHRNLILPRANMSAIPTYVIHSNVQ